MSYCPDLWRTCLCMFGPRCRRRHCWFAHRLCELRAPDESRIPYPLAWAKGVDRWFGQSMTREQVDRIATYYEDTPHGEVPQWVHGLLWMTRGEQWIGAVCLQWDYGLEMDQHMLRVRRRGSLPFEVMDGLWAAMHTRRVHLRAFAAPEAAGDYARLDDPQSRDRVRWRTQLCKYGPQCRLEKCWRAHRLCDLRAPDEVDARQDAIWSCGVDRWFGQTMSRYQLDLIGMYYGETAPGDYPQWVFGLLRMVSGGAWEGDVYLEWDYGLSMDAELLGVYRRDVLPFEYMPGLWASLQTRRQELRAYDPRPDGPAAWQS